MFDIRRSLRLRESVARPRGSGSDPLRGRFAEGGPKGTTLGMGQFVSHTLFDDAYTLLRFHDLTHHAGRDPRCPTALPSPGQHGGIKKKGGFDLGIILRSLDVEDKTVLNWYCIRREGGA